MEVVLDVNRCTGHGRCYDLAPDVFEPDDDGYGRVRAVIDPSQREAALAAARNCPEKAIIVNG